MQQKLRTYAAIHKMKQMEMKCQMSILPLGGGEVRGDQAYRPGNNSYSALPYGYSYKASCARPG